MIVEIWSDVMCPFCYIGKKNFEKALGQVVGAKNLKVEWKSFQLNRELSNKGLSTAEYLSQTKGLSHESLQATFSQIEKAGKEVGIEFDFNKAIVVNTASAHRLIQMAKEKGNASEAEELFFKAHFSEGKDVSKGAVLTEIGLQLGLTPAEIHAAETDPEIQNKVEYDLYEATQIGVRGVPFFLFDRKYAISGAQPVELFKDTIENILKEGEQLTRQQGTQCDIDGKCD